MSHVDLDTIYVDLDVCYCSLCDAYFPDVESRATHVLYSPNHPECTKCKIRFANGNALRNHYVISRRHNYCAACRREFRTPAGFRAHVEFASIHRDDEQDEDEVFDGIDDSYEGWEDDVGARLYPEDNDSDEPDVENDEAIPPEDEYWDDCDEPFPGDETYNGWAPVPPAAPATQSEADTVPVISPTSSATPPVPDVINQTTLPSMSKSSTSKSGSPIGSPEPADRRPSIALVGCPLCLEPAFQPNVTGCGHVFCSQCIHSALDIRKCCPVCRLPAISKQLRRVFFSAAPLVEEA